MSDCEYLGSVELDARGRAYIRPPQIPPPPPRAERPITLPGSVQRQVNGREVSVAPVIGTSMEPSILDSDWIVVSESRRPRHGDIVLVTAKSPDPLYGEIAGAVWRYHYRARQGYLRKDNPRYRGERTVVPREILGVVTRVLHRQYRDELENYHRVQTDIILYRECNWGAPPPDLGFHRERNVTAVRAIVSIPTAELLNGRLPVGLFRGIATANHPHLKICTGDALVIELTRSSHVGAIVIERNDAGETIVGVLQREDLELPRPGEFFIDLADRRVLITRRQGRDHLWYPIGIVRDIERRHRRGKQVS
jgi:signal peptidase I